MTEPTGRGPAAGGAPPSSVRPGPAFVALGVAVVAAVAGTLFVLRAARHMPPLPPPGQAAADSARRAPAAAPARPPARTRPGQPEFPRL
jgi:hypothetical protein